MTAALVVSQSSSTAVAIDLAASCAAPSSPFFSHTHHVHSLAVEPRHRYIAADDGHLAVHIYRLHTGGDSTPVARMVSI